MSDDELRAAYQARTPTRPGTAPPTAEELAALVAGTGTEEERLAILDRALADPGSARELELLRAVAVAESGETSLRIPSRWVPLAMAASVMLAVSVTLLVVSLQPADLLRAPPAAGVPLPIAPPDAAAHAPGNIPFVWHRVAGATGYRLELLSEAGALVLSASTGDTSAVLTAPGPSAYRWVVVALLPDGVEVPSSPRRLRIRP